jgi:hypothetical protein
MKNKKATAVANESPTFETTLVEIDAIKSNENNPRTIKDANLKKLVKSIRQFPEMLSLRPIIVDENNVILAGNMRHKAAKEVGFTHVPVIKASSLTQEQARQFIVKDNASFGDWDFAKLFEQYTLEELEDAAIELPTIDADILEEPEEPKINTAVVEVSHERHEDFVLKFELPEHTCAKVAKAIKQQNKNFNVTIDGNFVST